MPCPRNSVRRTGGIQFGVHMHTAHLKKCALSNGLSLVGYQPLPGGEAEVLALGNAC